MVTYNEKHNEANGEDNNDGSNNNRSWNCGVEGPTDDPDINLFRQRQIRNMLATLLLSQGTPMMLAGDEFGRTQQGNNNAYCQDSPISWLNWEIEEKGKHLIEFVKQLTTLRHKFPILRRNRWLTGWYDEELGVKDLTWINANGHEMEDQHWGDGNMKCFGMLIDGRAQPTGIHKRGEDATPAHRHQPAQRHGGVLPAGEPRRQLLAPADRHQHRGQHGGTGLTTLATSMTSPATPCCCSRSSLTICRRSSTSPVSPGASLFASVVWVPGAATMPAHGCGSGAPGLPCETRGARLFC